MNKQTSVIGRLYCPKDNSFIERLDNGLEGRLYGVWCEIISEPYRKTIHHHPHPPFDEMMVNVRSKETNDEYCVLWFEEWLLEKWTPTENDKQEKKVEVSKKKVS